MKYLILLVGLVSYTAFGQDAKAQEILDKLSAKMKAQKSYYIEFSANIKNSSSGTNETVTGKGWVKDNKFYASYGENTIISNGMKTWTVVKEEKTVYETDAADDDEESVNPKKLMTMWENGFKNKYGETETIDGVKCHKILLYPKEPGKVEYHTLVVYISTSTSELKKVVMRGKDGTNTSYSLTEYQANPAIDDSKFVYDAKKYPGYTLVKD
jgi:outer membrane lipoprotein-sorting protein